METKQACILHTWNPRCYSQPRPATKGGHSTFRISNGGRKSDLQCPPFRFYTCGGSRHTLWMGCARGRGHHGPWMARHAQRDACEGRKVRLGNGLRIAVGRPRRCTNQAWFLGSYHPVTSLLGPDRAHPNVCKHEYVPPHASSDARNASWKASATSFTSFHVVSDRTAVVFQRAVTPFSQLHCVVSRPPSSHPRGRYTLVPGSRGFLCFSEVYEGRGWRDHQIHPLCEQTHLRVGHVATCCATCDASSFDFHVERDVVKADLISRKKSVRKNSDSIDPRTRECEPTGNDGVFFCCFGCGW